MVCLIDYYINAGGKTIMDNAYGYDVVSNVLSVVNKAAIPEKGKAGGQMSYNYTYDALYCLSTASGTYKGADNKAASYTLSMGYDNMHRITSKKQHLSQTGVQFEGTLNAGYELAYTYGKDAGRKFQLDNVRDINYRTEETPTESMNINNGHKYTYDLNGNLVYINTSRVKRDGKEDEKATEQKYRWDEENHLMVLSDNSKTSRYTYNAAGERIMKSYGTMEGVYINGAPQGITLTNVDFRLHQDKMSKLFCAWFALKFHETDNFTLYPASIISINKNRFTKHYFIGDKRIASRIGTGLFNNVYGRNGSYITAGQQDYAERMNQIQKQKEAYYKQQGIAPGVPTMKGAYGDPENTGVGYNSVLTELGNHDVPQGWIQTPHPNTTPGTNPGPPVSWNDPSNPDDPQAGYGYIPNDTTKEETFFYHSDHLGSTSYITDDKANITQYDAYLPYGELLVDEHSSSEDLPYKFNGKQFDEETGLYYYGARYMNPMASIWYGVDPLAEKYTTAGSFLYCVNNPIKLVDPNGKKILPTLYNKVNRGHSKAEGSHYRSKTKYMSAMKRFASTTYGKKFIGNFLEKGISQYGAKGTGKFADCILWIQEYDLGNVDETVQRDYMGNNNGSFNVFVMNNQLYVELRLDVTNRSEDELSETIAHELALHGSDVSKYVKAYRENKNNPAKASEVIDRMMSQDPHGDKDHADLENNNLSNIGVVNYLNTMKEMGLNPKKQVKE